MCLLSVFLSTPASILNAQFKRGRRRKEKEEEEEEEREKAEQKIEEEDDYEDLCGRLYYIDA